VVLSSALQKAIVERHGGTITAHNDGGAVFDIALPAPRREEEEHNYARGTVK
jgi:signal transduction histidine kinase